MAAYKKKKRKVVGKSKSKRGAGAKVRAVKGQAKGRKTGRTVSKKRATAGSRARRRP
jgi:hypothetical protein